MQPKFIPCLILFWLTCLAFTLNVGAGRLPIRIYTSADGLGSSFVDSLMRDSRGFMWFCTRDGLSRFDGSRFVTYQIGDKASPPGIESIYEARNGTYWITTTGGLYRFNPTALSSRKITEGGRPILNAEFLGDRRGHFYEDRKGTLWFAGNGLYRIEERDKKVDFQNVELPLPLEANQEYVIQAISEGEDGSLWLSSTFGLIRRLPDERVVFYRYQVLLSGDVAGLVLDKENRVWVKLDLTLFVLKPEPIEALSRRDQTTTQFLKPGSITQLRLDEEIRMPSNPGELIQIVDTDRGDHWTRGLFEASDGHIWISSEKGLVEYDGRVFHRYSSSTGLPISMSQMAEDAAANLWIGGQTGLVRLDRKGLTSFGESDGLNSTRLTSISESPDGTLYVTNGDFFLSKFDGQSFRTVQLEIAPTARSIWTSRTAFLDSRGEWWVVTNEGLYRFRSLNRFDSLNQSKALTTYTNHDGLKSDRVFQVFEDKHGDIWVSTRGPSVEGSGLSRLNRAENRFYTFTEKESFPTGKSASSFAEDKTGRLWFGFYEGGVARYANDRFTLFSEKDGLPGGVVTDLHIDRMGRMWLSSTIGGLYRLDDTNQEHPHFVAYTTDNGLSSNNIRSITEDHFGNIYLGTVRGVDRLTPETNRVKHYSVSDGLASDFVVDSHCDKNGVLWFATTNGLSRLIPQPNETPTAPQVWIGGLHVSGLAQPISELGSTQIESLELNHTQNSFQIDFFGLDFRPGETLRYQYKLEGTDSAWSAATEQRTVTYPTLQPGTYRFLVQAVNSDGIRSEKPAIVSFRILPPIWLRWWFITLATALALGLLYSFHRYRMARLAEAKRAEEDLGQAREDRLTELERVRTRIATDLHDDIGASLTQISILSEVARQQGRNANGAMSGPLKSIADVSNELVDTMSDIVWAINPRKDTLQDLIQRMRRFASDLLSAKGIAFEFETPTFTPEIPLGANPRREVFLIFKESLANVVKHSEATRVAVELTFSAESLELKITDNGRGLEVAKLANERSLFSDQKGGNGILNMKRRAREMDGDFEIVSELGKGTVTTFKLPLATTQLGGDNRRPDGIE